MRSRKRQWVILFLCEVAASRQSTQVKINHKSELRREVSKVCHRHAEKVDVKRGMARN